jgi:hypothetical protein
VNRSRATRLSLAATLACASVLWLAGSATSTTSSHVVTFSHEDHLARTPEARCKDCHEVAKGATLPVVRWASCAQCHDETPTGASRRRGRTLGVVFEHDAHAKSLTCGACHARRSGEDAPRLAPEHTRPSGPDCLSCHATRNVGPAPLACASCHGRDQRRTKPSSHDASWRRRHGAFAEPLAPAAHGQRCLDCHRESSCRGCHDVERPRDHTALWRVRGHGVAASWDRDRCKTCHQTASCTACHATTEPRSHGPTWRATHGLVARSRADTSCLTCHRPSTCLQCHQGGR